MNQLEAPKTEESCSNSPDLYLRRRLKKDKIKFPKCINFEERGISTAMGWDREKRKVMVQFIALQLMKCFWSIFINLSFFLWS